MTPTNTSAALVVFSETADKKIKPPIRKGELIEALALRQRQNMQETYEANKLEIEKLTKELDTDAVRLVKKFGKLSEDSVYWCTTVTDQGTRVANLHSTSTVPDDSIPTDFRAKAGRLTTLRKQNNNGIPSIYDLKNRIRAKVNGELLGSNERISEILKDPATLKAVDSILLKLNEAK